MSAASVQLLREGIEAYNRGDLSFVLEHAADDIEVQSDAALANAGTYHGRAAFERWARDWLEAWSEFKIEVSRIEEVAGRFLLVDVIQRGTGSGSGVEVAMELTQLVEVRDGEVARLHLYPARLDAAAAVARLQAAGP